MGNDVQLHESVVERAPGEERRASPRHAASSLGSVSARIIGGSQVELVNFSARGVLFECDSRLLIGARASVRITTTDANLIVTGRVVRSRVKGLVNGALRYDAALALDSELALQPAYTEPVRTDAAPATVDDSDEDASADVAFGSDEVAFESEPGLDGAFDPAPVEAYLAASDAALAEIVSVAEPPPVPVDDGEAPAEPLHVNVSVDLQPIDAAPDVVALVADPEPVGALEEIVAFEADGGEVAFEASSDFEFEALPSDAAPSSETIDAPEASSLFDATYRAPAEEAPVAGDSMFETTPPTPVYESSASSMFDSRRSEQYGESAAAEPIVPEPIDPEPGVAEAIVAATIVTAPTDATPAVDAAAEAVDAEAGAVDFETDVSFEAEDAVMFEAAFEGDVATPDAAEFAAPIEAAGSIEPTAPGDVPPPLPDAAAETASVAAAEAVEPIEVIEPVEEGLDALADVPPPMPAADDRVLLQFSATVPHDLAELRRIAADNQW